MSTYISSDLDRNRALYLLTMQDAAYRGMANAWPRPRWCKYRADGEEIFLMVWMNRACAERFYANCSPYRVIGHCDRVCWPDEQAAHYAETDRAAIERHGEIVETFEPTGEGSVRVLKFAFRVETEQLKGWYVYGECPDD